MYSPSPTVLLLNWQLLLSLIDASFVPFVPASPVVILTPAPLLVVFVVLSNGMLTFWHVSLFLAPGAPLRSLLPCSLDVKAYGLCDGVEMILHWILCGAPHASDWCRGSLVDV